MQAIGPTFGEAPFASGRETHETLRWLLPWSVALAFGACLEPLAMRGGPAAPDLFLARGAENAPAAARAAANPYGALVDPFFSRGGGASAKEGSAEQARLEAALALVVAARLAPPVRDPYGTLVDYFAAAEPAAPSPAAVFRASLEAAVAAPQPAEAPLPPRREVARVDGEAPLPPARPAEFAPLAEPERRAPRTAESAAPADDRGFFERLFGLGRAPAATDRAAGLAVFARSAPPSGYDQFTAVYDISARMVYMPDGTRLEAHSGLGSRLDDPRFVDERMRGATPPHLYALGPREEPFHGVPALRLTPIGDGDVFGRAGLLAHSYMLGPRGESNGCVSFKDYEAFLRAFREGQVKRLAVVTRL